MLERRVDSRSGAALVRRVRKE
eukprot:SAG31_NODE_35284_length_324_cov_1.351111_1_plen_21_part_10